MVWYMPVTLLIGMTAHAGTDIGCRPNHSETRRRSWPSLSARIVWFPLDAVIQSETCMSHVWWLCLCTLAHLSMGSPRGLDLKCQSEAGGGVRGPGVPALG